MPNGGPFRLPQGGETCGFTHTFKGLTALQKHKTSRVFDCRFKVKKRVSASNGALTASQQRPPCNATAAPVQCNKGLVATPRGRFCNLTEALSENRKVASILKRLTIKVLRKL